MEKESYALPASPSENMSFLRAWEYFADLVRRKEPVKVPIAAFSTRHIHFIVAKSQIR